MAERRMFTKKVTDDDIFTAMPPTTQCLYFHLCMGADDDGFSNNIRIAMFNAHASTDDFNTLVQKHFIIPFESGVIVITHWKLHNYIRSDRYNETKHLEEKARLVLKENKIYEMSTNGIPNGYQMDTQDRLDKNRLDKVNYLEADKSAPTTTKRFKKPTLDELQEYISEKGYRIDAEKFLDYYESNGWKVGKNPMKDWKAAVRNWNRNNTNSTIKPSPNKNKFSNFQQRDDNLEALEKKLLGY